HQPVGVAPVEAAAGAHWRNARHVRAVGKGGADDIELVFHTPDAPVERADVELTLEFGAAKYGVALRVDRLIEFEARAQLTRTLVTRISCQPAEYEAIEPRVIARDFAPRRVRSAVHPRSTWRSRCRDRGCRCRTLRWHHVGRAKRVRPVSARVRH